MTNIEMGAPLSSGPAAEDGWITHVTGLNELVPRLKLIICDLWGVMHDGIHAHTEAAVAIDGARDAGVRSVFLSNAPRPRYHVRNQLIQMGMPERLTDFIVTSGGLARDAVRSRFDGAALYHLGPAEDHNTLEGLPVDLVRTPEDADVILATGLAYLDVDRHRPLLAGAAEKKTPFLCANPDRVVHVGPKLYLCAGTIADIYEAMDGPVEWFGKPTAGALFSCLDEVGLAGSHDKKSIVMIGDSLQTDIAGANAAGFDSLFIAGGIHRKEWPDMLRRVDGKRLTCRDFDAVVGEGKPTPGGLMEKLVW